MSESRHLWLLKVNGHPPKINGDANKQSQRQTGSQRHSVCITTLETQRTTTKGKPEKILQRWSQRSLWTTERKVLQLLKDNNYGTQFYEAWQFHVLHASVDAQRVDFGEMRKIWLTDQDLNNDILELASFFLSVLIKNKGGN